MTDKPDEEAVQDRLGKLRKGAKDNGGRGWGQQASEFYRLEDQAGISAVERWCNGEGHDEPAKGRG